MALFLFIIIIIYSGASFALLLFGTFDYMYKLKNTRYIYFLVPTYYIGYYILGPLFEERK